MPPHQSAAVAFVQTHGTPVEQARLAYLLDSIPPAPEIIASVFADQHSDGGWPAFWAPDYVSLDATCYRLAQAEPFGLILATRSGHRALDFNAHRQQIVSKRMGTGKKPRRAMPFCLPGLHRLSQQRSAISPQIAAFGSRFVRTISRSVIKLPRILKTSSTLQRCSRCHTLPGYVRHSGMRVINSSVLSRYSNS